MNDAALTRALEVLSAGGLVAFPTETVYGLGADAENPAAVARIYAAKGRPNDHPVIVHLAPEAELARWAAEIPPAALELRAAFWPGPLTIILKRASGIPDCVSGGQDTVGLRCPSHPVAIALLSAFKGGQGGLAAPSANKFGQVSPTTALHVRHEFADDAGVIGAILDGGQSQVGIESTIVDLSRLSTHGPVLLRPGHISAQAIAQVIGTLPAMPAMLDPSAPRASGTLDSHYAPHTPVVLEEHAILLATLLRLQAAHCRVALIHISDCAVATSSVRLPAEVGGYAHGLYAALRAMDLVGADLILIEAPPQGAAWVGVNDRLRRAAHGSGEVLRQLLQP